MLKYTNFLLFWFGQFVSALGSSMTGFALTLWAYQKTGSALVLSVSGLLVMLPRMVGGIFAAPLVDRLNKKAVMLVSDLAAGLCTLALFFLLSADSLEIRHIYLLNFISGLLGSFQTPAGAVMVSLLVPREYYVKAGGLQSFAGGAAQVLSPVLAAALLGFAGMGGVIVFDLATMLFACLTLLCLVKLPAAAPTPAAEKAPSRLRQYAADLREGVYAIARVPILRPLVLLHVYINFVAGLTYFSLISPLILARTQNSAQALAWVNSGLGLGGIAGGFLIALLPAPKSKIKRMFLCCGLSFLLGDLSFALGRSLWLWVGAGFVSNLLIPPFSANEDYFWRTAIPLEIQGRAFSFRYAAQSGVIPLGMVSGGFLADRVFAPYMAGHNPFSALLGGGQGQGMALMFLITGTAGAVICLCGFFSKRLARLETELEPVLETR